MNDKEIFYAAPKELFVPSFLYYLMEYMGKEKVQFPDGEQYERSQLKAMDSWDDIQPMKGGE